jgi:hypothetical protein
MGPFEYFIIFIAILIGLAVESVAKNLDVLLEAGRRVRWHWMAPATALSSVISVLSQFWLIWQLRAHYRVGSFLFVLPVVATMVVLYLVASATLPREVPPEGLDLKEWYFDNRKRYWGLMLALVVSFALTDAVILFTHAVPAKEAIGFIAQSTIVAAICIWLMRTRAVWPHGIFIVLLLAVNVVGNANLQLN